MYILFFYFCQFNGYQRLRSTCTYIFDCAVWSWLWPICRFSKIIACTFSVNVIDQKIKLSIEILSVCMTKCYPVWKQVRSACSAYIEELELQSVYISVKYHTFVLWVIFYAINTMTLISFSANVNIWYFANNTVSGGIAHLESALFGFQFSKWFKTFVTWTLSRPSLNTEEWVL